MNKRIGTEILEKIANLKIVKTQKDTFVYDGNDLILFLSEENEQVTHAQTFESKTEINENGNETRSKTTTFYENNK